jgi:hypothetical protein
MLIRFADTTLGMFKLTLCNQKRGFLKFFQLNHFLEVKHVSAMYTDLPQSEGYFSNELQFLKILESVRELFNVTKNSKTVVPNYKTFLEEDKAILKTKPKTSYYDNTYSVNEALKKQVGRLKS